jgi:hypothetical protein
MFTAPKTSGAAENFRAWAFSNEFGVEIQRPLDSSYSVNKTRSFREFKSLSRSET